MKRRKVFTLLLAISFVIAVAFDWNLPSKTLVIGLSLILLFSVIRELFYR